MFHLNRVTLFGNLGRDPEVRMTQDGRKVVTFSLATNESWKAKDGSRHERTEWHRVVIFSPGLADTAERLLRKGACVYVEGKLRTRSWTDSDGAEKTTTEVVVDYDGGLIIPNAQETNSVGSARQGYGNPQAQRPAARPTSAQPSLSKELGDEIPF